MTDERSLWAKPTARQCILLLTLGLIAGFLSGMFGVGGGILIVPGLIAIMKFDLRLAAGTSLATIVPLAAVGVLSYARVGAVSWLSALLLAAGALVGSPVGTWLQSRLNGRRLQVFFGCFMIISVTMLFVLIPGRDAVMQIGLLAGIALVAVGFATGVLSGLLGVGGGVIVVPVLMLLFGASDLVARGTSLLMMIPAALSGTVANVLRRNLNVPAALVVGVAACLTTVGGSHVAQLVSPLAANICFAGFLVVVAGRMIFQGVRAAGGPKMSVG